MFFSSPVGGEEMLEILGVLEVRPLLHLFQKPSERGIFHRALRHHRSEQHHKQNGKTQRKYSVIGEFTT